MHGLALVAALSLLQTPTNITTDQVLEDVRKLSAAQDNEGRFAALTEMLRARNISFVVEPFKTDSPAKDRRTEGRNVVATFGGGGQEIVIGAHYDAVPLPDGTLSRGAVDNGASSVMLVHLADALRAERLQTRVKIVWFDMEESGLVGSARYVQAHASDRIVAMINFDINAYGDTILFGPPQGGNNARLHQMFAETCASEQIDCLRFPGMPTGDDRSFGKAGIPTISSGILPALEAHQLWLLLHGGSNSGLVQGTVPPILRTIHTTEDQPAKVDGLTVARVHRFTLALVRRLSAPRP